MPQPILKIEGVSLARSGQPVLHEVNLHIAPGEIVMIMGPSGSGKSSLLRCLNRLEEPEQGAIRLDGQDIRALPVIELRTRVGMIFQKTAPFPGTVTANVRFGPGLRGQTLPDTRVRELLEAAALPVDLADHPAERLSGGQEQRLAIARALANEPEVLLLDEPTSALDPIATRAVEETLQGLRQRLGLTLVWVSHSAEQARRVGDRLILLESGRITREGPISALLDPADGDPHVLAFAAGLDSSET
jgi:putative ABC transport system ATP-binding protein